MGTTWVKGHKRGKPDSRKAKVTTLQREVTTSCVLHGSQWGARPFPNSGHTRVSQQRALLKHKHVCRLRTHSWTAEARLHCSPAAPAAGGNRGPVTARHLQRVPTILLLPSLTSSEHVGQNEVRGSLATGRAHRTRAARLDRRGTERSMFTGEPRAGAQQGSPSSTRTLRPGRQELHLFGPQQRPLLMPFLLP